MKKYFVIQNLNRGKYLKAEGNSFVHRAEYVDIESCDKWTSKKAALEFINKYTPFRMTYFKIIPIYYKD
jgi:hypothetical protein